MDEYMKVNQDRWNELVAIHARSKFYDVESFKAGTKGLNYLEREEVGDVSGKSLLHLQCHFGMDTLSWARLGAQVTGVDFADKAIALAKDLSQELQRTQGLGVRPAAYSSAKRSMIRAKSRSKSRA